MRKRPKAIAEIISSAVRFWTIGLAHYFGIFRGVVFRGRTDFCPSMTASESLNW